MLVTSRSVTVRKMTAERKWLKKRHIALIVVCCIVIIFFGFELASFMPAGTMYQIPARQYMHGEKSFNSATKITGTFYVQDGSASFQILTPQEYSVFVSSGGTNNNVVYATQYLVYGTVEVSLPAGTYYFLFINDGLSTSVVWVTLPFESW